MDITELIGVDTVVPSLRVTSKKQALQELAKRSAELTGMSERTIFDVLLERERLGTTGVGNGIAIPHGKLAELKKLYGLFARLEQPVAVIADRATTLPAKPRPFATRRTLVRACYATARRGEAKHSNAAVLTGRMLTGRILSPARPIDRHMLTTTTSASSRPE